MKKFVCIATIILILTILRTLEIEKIAEFSSSEVYGPSNYSLSVDDNYLYSVSHRGLHIFNIQNDSLEFINEINLEGSNRTLSLNNQFAYVAAGNPVNCLYQINITDVSNLAISNSLSYPGLYNHFIDGNHLFVHEWDFDFERWIIHVYNAYTLQQITQFIVPFNDNIMRPVIDGISIVKINNMAHLYNISDPQNIVLISEHNIGETFFPYKSTIIQDSILVFGDVNGIRFYDINNNWFLLNEIEDSSLSICIENNNLISYNSNNIYLYDISNIYNPTVLDSISFSFFDGMSSMTSEQGTFFYTTGLGILEMCLIDNNQFENISSYYNYGYLSSGYLNENNLVLSTTLNGLTAWDLDDPTNPLQLDSYYPEFYPTASIYGDENICSYSYFDVENEIINHKILQLTEDHQVIELDEITTANELCDLHYLDGVGFFQVYDNIFHKYTLNNNVLEEVAFISIPSAESGEIYFNSNIAYIISPFQISIIDQIDNNENMALVNQFNINILLPASMDFFENYLFLSEQVDVNSCYIFDITDPLDPILFTTINSSGIITIDQEHELMFLGSRSLNIYDLSTIPSGPILEIETIFNWDYCEHLSLFNRNGNNYLLFLDATSCSIYEYNSTSVIQEQTLSLDTRLFNYPNPFNPTTTISYSMLNDDNVEVSIFNIKGQKVSTLINEQKVKGKHSIIWNGDDKKGNPVSSGIYFYRIKVSNQEYAKRMLLLK